jgi:HTH-type transcriptional regulator/antitoxin HigA
MDNPSPGTYLADELETRSWDAVDLAFRSGLPLDMIHRILNGTHYVTEVTSIRLSQALGTTPFFWLDLQRRHLDELSGTT